MIQNLGSQLCVIIESIQAQLSAHVPALQYVDMDWGQMDFFGESPPVKYPCALIDVTSANYSNTGQLCQQGEATIVIHLYDLRLSNTSFRAPQNQKITADKLWQIIEDVNKALHGQNFLPHGYGLPIRQAMQQNKREGGYCSADLYYTVQFTDNTCLPNMELANATPTLKLGIIK